VVRLKNIPISTKPSYYRSMAPVQAIGFEDLSKRVEAQAKMTELHTTKLKASDFFFLHF